MKLSEELQWRGFVKHSTFDDSGWLNTPRKVYFGVDPSADSLHVGNLASFMPLRHMIDAGWEVILLVGGATGMIGDPGGKSVERNLLSLEELAKNKKAVEAQVKKLFAGKPFKLVDNLDWLQDLKLLDFLRETGKYFSMTPLVQRDYIATRMGEGGSGISYTEFSYTLLQGYDYWYLNKKYDVELQYGGSDQWGNMLSGVELIRRKEGKEAHVLAGPLVVDNATGAKFGKSEAGAIWLDPEKTTPHDFYQFWLNVDDGAVRELLGYFTLLSKDEIDKIYAEFDKDRASRSAQRVLAKEVTTLVHGKSAAEEAEAKSHVLKVDSAKHSHTASHVDLTVSSGDSVIDALVATGLAGSKTEARQLLGAGGIYINDQKTDKESFAQSDFEDGLLKLRRGKTLQNTKFVRLK